MDDNISSMGTTSPPEVMPGAMLRERTDCYLDFTNEDCLQTEDFSQGDSEPVIVPQANVPWAVYLFRKESSQFV